MAEASVAVKKPKTIQPITIKSNKRLGRALIKLEMIFLKLLLFTTGSPLLYAQIAATIIRKNPIMIPGR